MLVEFLVSSGETDALLVRVDIDRSALFQGHIEAQVGVIDRADPTT